MLHLSIVDAATAAPPPAPLPGTMTHTWREHDGTEIATGYTVNGEHWMDWPHLASFCFRDDADAVVALAHAPTRTELITDTFRRSVLPMALQRRGHEVLHSSAVQLPQGVVALCAVSETGKSTLAYALSRRGYPLWADDAVALTINKHSVRSVPLPFRIRLRPRSAAFFAPEQANTDETTQAAAAAHSNALPLAAICILEQRPSGALNSVVDVQRFAPVDAFREVLAHAYCFNLDDLERKRTMLQHYLMVAQHVPIFAVRFQTGLQHVDAIVNSVVQSVDQITQQASRPV